MEEHRAQDERRWTLRGSITSAEFTPTCVGGARLGLGEEVEVVPASRLERTVEERDLLRAALVAAVNGFDGWREQAFAALGWTDSPASPRTQRGMEDR